MITATRAADRAERAVQSMRRAVIGATDGNDLMERVSGDVHDHVAHDACTWFGADPVTLLATSPIRVEAFHQTECHPFWHREFHDHDTALFVDLARRDDPVSALRIDLGDRPIRSVRYREMMRPNGYTDEIRGALRVGGSTWGFFGLYRYDGRPAFDDTDVAVMRALSPVIAEALREHVRCDNPWLGDSLAPGLMVFDATSTVVSANTEAFEWMHRLAPDLEGPFHPDTGPILDVMALDDHLGRVSTPLMALVARTRSSETPLDREASRVRVRDRDGRWVLMHGSPMRGPGSPDEASVAVVIEPARRTEIAPIIVEAHSLTPRERDVLGALSRGSTTSEIAGALFLSPHTVRDHVKTIFEKVNVSSRAELVAKLYAEHYWDPGHADAVQIH